MIFIKQLIFFLALLVSTFAHTTTELTQTASSLRSYTITVDMGYYHDDRPGDAVIIEVFNMENEEPKLNYPTETINTETYTTVFSLQNSHTYKITPKQVMGEFTHANPDKLLVLYLYKTNSFAYAMLEPEEFFNLKNSLFVVYTYEEEKADNLTYTFNMNEKLVASNLVTPFIDTAIEDYKSLRSYIV